MLYYMRFWVHYISYLYSKFKTTDIDSESCQSGRSCGTRNAVSFTGPRVRIPDSPPSSSQAMYRL